MEANLYYISFSGDKANVPLSLVRQVQSILLQENLCLQLDNEEKNWLVFSEKEDETLWSSIARSLTSGTLYIKALPADNPLSAYITHIESSLEESRQSILDTIKKNGTLLEENTILRLQKENYVPNPELSQTNTKNAPILTTSTP
ncbi:MAG: hypothetical protein IJT97_05200 [Bacteroidaceae bacterium]|nr:hypothetical protein [Bacteroidaceae bacterium]